MFEPRTSSSKGTSGISGIFYLIVWLGSLIAAYAMIKPEHAVIAAERQGWSQVKVVSAGYIFTGWRGCGVGDAVVFQATGKNPAGGMTRMILCVGFLKGETIRTDAD